MEYTENKILPERALLVALDTGEYDAESSLDELWELAKSGGAEPVATLTQKRPAPETATCVGSGMVQEIRTFCEDNAIELIIFDRELTPTQIRNLEKETDVRVVDRTMLILDIFAQRAQSRAGKVQVEMAQLKYMLPRLSGKGAALSRLGGGIGTRGPGETKLETDRRHIRRRIESLREQLKKVETGRRETQRRREKDGTVTVALVGYTNAGKSTLMNLLHASGRARGGQALRDARPHGARVEAARRQDRHAHRHGRPCAPPAAPFRGGVSAPRWSRPRPRTSSSTSATPPAPRRARTST
jgi:GTP-binding protein HflX